MLIYTEAVWRSLYRRPLPRVDGDPVAPPLTYGRDYEFFDGVDPVTLMPQRAATSQRAASRRAALAGLGALGNVRVICIGSAFGFLMEELIDAGLTDTWGVEPSPYVWANTDEIRADVLAQTVNAAVGVTPTNTIQSQFAALGMGNPRRGDWIMDEDALCSMQNDTEVNAFLDGCEALLQGGQHARIVHIVTPATVAFGPGDSSINWKTLDEWRAYRPSHTWVDARAVD